MGYRGQPTVQQAVQWAHFVTAGYLAMLLVRFGCPDWVGLAAIPVWILLKEWVWDYWIPVPKIWWLKWVGEEDTWQGSLLDSGFYVIGGLVIATVFWFTRK